MDKLSEAQIKNFTLISKLGQGSTAIVTLAKMNQTKKICALKTILKQGLLNQNDKQRIIQEKNVYIGLNHPFIVKIYQTFQTRKHFFFALQYCQGGDLYTNLHMIAPLTQQRIAFYSSQLILAIEHLHENNIIYRDLKPQNILLAKDGYLKLTDFGLSVQVDNSNNIDGNINGGTTQYTAPQMLNGQGHGFAYDWWMLGCTIYQMVHKISPFYSDNRKQMFEKIINQQPKFHKNISSQLQNLIKGLLDKNPATRLEFAKRIKNDIFFTNINFDKIYKKQLRASYIPNYSRGKQFLKVNKNDINEFINFSQLKTCKDNYVQGFDYSMIESSSIISQDNISSKKISKNSTIDSQQETENSQQENKNKQIIKYRYSISERA